MSAAADPSATPRVWGTLDPFFEPGAFLGRRVANSGFLRALFGADPYDEYHFFLASKAQHDAASAGLKEYFPELVEAGRVRIAHRLELPQYLATHHYAVFHLSDCINYPAHVARLRNLHSAHCFPVTSLTHSLSRADYQRAFFTHLWPGACARDCIVGTSRAGVDAVRGFFGTARAGYGLTEDRLPGPSVECLPLGMEAAAFAAQVDAPGVRLAVRNKLGVGERVVVLTFGRISHHAKMDLLPLLRAMARVRREHPDVPQSQELALVLAGPVEAREVLGHVGELAKNAGIMLVGVESPDEEQKAGLFAAADIFCSPVDNPQETFGLTMLEAGAAGLPTVASDYDGYRDLLVHGETGLLVPTLGPDASEALNALAAVTADNQYHLLFSQRTAVDVQGLADALARLGADPALRRTMGHAARQRVLQYYEWSQVVPRYVALWEELATRDTPADPTAPHPLHLDFAATFAAYPTRQLADDMVLERTVEGHAVYDGREFPILYSGLASHLDLDVARHLLFVLRKPRTVAEALDALNKKHSLGDEAGRAHILWLVKQGFVHVLPATNAG